MEIVALVGDVVRSRAHRDQQALMRRVARVLSAIDGQIPALQGLALSVGDEFQGAYADISSALRVTLFLQLLLPEGPLLRVGVGRGKTTPPVEAGGLGGQSGSAWWRAREALETLESRESAHGWPRTLRTSYRARDATEQARVQAFLICRDHLLASMSKVDARVTLGLFRGERQAELASELGITQSSVSRRQAEKGGAAVFRAHQAFEEVLS